MKRAVSGQATVGDHRDDVRMRSAFQGDSAISNERIALLSTIDQRSLDRRQLFGLVRCLPNGNFRVGGDATRLLNLPARKPVVGANRQYLREGRMRGFVCASLLRLAAPWRNVRRLC